KTASTVESFPMAGYSPSVRSLTSSVPAAVSTSLASSAASVISPATDTSPAVLSVTAGATGEVTDASASAFFLFIRTFPFFAAVAGAGLAVLTGAAFVVATSRNTGTPSSDNPNILSATSSGRE